MDRSRGAALAAAVLAGLSAACAAGEIAFSSKPRARRTAEGVEIAFAVAAGSDVEVAVLGPDGKVVRHLAAGVLGGAKAPPAPLKPGLSQTVLWDGRDDLGKPAGEGPFRARVRAGTSVRFNRFIGGDPYTFGTIVGLAADEEGFVYLLAYDTSTNQRQMAIRVFDPGGKYVREILPFPADLGPGEMKDLARWDAVREAFYPGNLKNLNPSFYGGGRSGHLELVSVSRKNGVVLTDGMRVYGLDVRGAVRGESFAVQDLWTRDVRIKNSGSGPTFLAASPDGKWLYLSGPYASKTQYGHKFIPEFPPGRVYRVAAGAPGPMKPFVTIDVEHDEGQGGKWTRASAAMQHFTAPKGPVHQTAVDSQGRVYVADRENGRIAVFDASGAAAASLPVKNPHLVAIHPKTGAVYAMEYDCVGYGKFRKVLMRFDRVVDGEKPAAAIELSPEGKFPSMAVSVGPERTIVWVAGVKEGLVALEDKGASFEKIATSYAPKDVQVDWNRLAVDYGRDEIYVSDGATLVYRYDGETGKGELLKKDGKTFHVNDLAVGYDGNLYVRVSGKFDGSASFFSGPFWRLGRDLGPVPFEGTATHVLSKYIYGRYGIGTAERGIGVGPDGKVYISWMYQGWAQYSVTGFGPDGRPLAGRQMVGKCHEANYKGGAPEDLKSAVIGPVPPANGGIRVDLAGNIYVGMRLWPKDVPYPAGWEKSLAFDHSAGSVVRFTPAGGRVADPRAKDEDSRPSGAPGISMRRGEIAEGAVMAYPGMAPFSHAGFGENTCCVCRVPRFDIDRYGRLVMPNAITNSVLLVDNAGNLILEFGRYGNFDSRHVNPESEKGKEGEPTVAVPEIPLGWPTGAGFSPGHIYVNDTYSRRVVRLDMQYAAEETCEVE